MGNSSGSKMSRAVTSRYVEAGACPRLLPSKRPCESARHVARAVASEGVDGPLADPVHVVAKEQE